MKWLWLVIPMVFMAAPAYAGWDDDHDGIGVAAVGCEEVKPNPGTQRRCWFNYVNATGTGNSPMLTIDQCENYSVAFTPDYSGVDTASTGTFYVCLDDTDIQACHALEGKTLSSSVPVIYGADGTWGYFDIGVICTAAAECRVEFRCNQ
jgi:hypothetical protein